MLNRRQQLIALVRKNYIIQLRSKKELAIMIFLPALFMMVFAILRATELEPKTFKEKYGQTRYELWKSLCLAPKNLQLLYSPRSYATDTLMATVYQRIQIEYDIVKPLCLEFEDPSPSFFAELKPFDTEKEMEKHVVDNFENVFAGVVFLNPRDPKDNDYFKPDIKSLQWHYKIRMKGADLPDTSATFQEFEVGPSDSGIRYFKTGFTYLQTTIDNEIHKLWSPNATVQPSAEQFPFPKYTDTLFYQVIGDALSFYVCLGFLLFVIKLISRLVVEKEKKIKETMKIMGLSDTVFWLSWFVYAFSIMFVTMLLLAFVVKVGGVFEKSDFGLIFIFFQLWGISVICFCFLISVFFNKSKVASALGAVILFLALLPNIAVTSDSSAGSQFGACLLSPTCLALGLEKFADYEEAQEGITSSNMYDGDFNFASVLTMLLIDIGIYSFMAWYLDQVLPREYGIRRSWYFLLQPSYWGFSIGENAVRSNSGVAHNDDDPNTEKVPPELQSRLSVQIMGLHKKFTMGSGKTAKKKTAVDRLDLCMYEGQIMSLLGHNGAGKTTTVSMLTGFFPPSGGDAIIYGMSIRDKMERIRENIGLCSQYNVLWDELTVEEHLYLFAALKGVPYPDLQNHVEERIKDVGLEEKAQSLSKDLSGGQKRKLCVAIAFTGGTKIIFLDEPTSGMDPFSRRAIWSLLQRLKDNRTIILTTHFMDEADLLGDRIAIMNHGKLAACGSSLFLKSRFGVGYTLTVVKKQQCIERNVTGFLMQYSPEIRLLSNVGAELSYVIPLSSSHIFGRLFSAFEQNKDGLLVDSYGISVTTLEEVFLRIANAGAQEQQPSPQNNTTNGQHSMTVRDLDERIRNAQAKIYDPSIKYIRSSIRQFYALLSKRFLVSRRDSKALFQMLFYPSLFILLAVIASKSRPSGRNENKYIFANSNYGADVNIFAANNGTNLNLPGYLSVDMQSVNSWWEEPYHWAPNSEATVTNYSNTTLRCALLACQLPSVKAKLDDPVTSQQISEKYGKCLEQYTSGWRNDTSVFNPTNCKGLHSAVSFQQYDSSIVDYTAFFDTTAFHSLPTALNYVSNAILRNLTKNQEAFIITVNHPLPDPEFVGEDYGRSFTLSLYVGIALCIIPGALITSVMRERETKAAHQQLVCGVDSRMLWATYLISDMVLFMIAVIFFFLIFAGTRTDAFIGDNFVATIILFITYGLSVFPCTYAISFYIKSSTSAQSRITAGYISLSLAALIVISVLYAIPSTSDYAEPIDYIFTLIPTYAVAIGVFYISLNELAKSVPGQIVRDPMHWKVAGRPITFLVIEAIFFMALVHFLQTGMVEEWYFKYIKAKEVNILLHWKITKVSGSDCNREDNAYALRNHDLLHTTALKRNPTHCQKRGS
eukprot:TRINITY_DN2139_c0_g1_i4.p1 TRINITY_DN2139_c0_g1~~TRINITY_DN2139_c0_g1_i4.p1  ORF type:complete len:1384 (+),score=248.88 TRINITY_DN2139_c0_g1_i4:167-4318(+)